MPKKTRRSFSPEEKVRIIDEARKSGNMSEVAVRNGLNANRQTAYRMLKKWVDSEASLRAKASEGRPVISTDTPAPQERGQATAGLYRLSKADPEEIRRLREEIEERDRLIVELTLKNARLTKGS